MIEFLIDNGFVDAGEQMAVTGKTHNENLKDVNESSHPVLTPGQQEIIRPLDNPIKATCTDN